ncbi:hypothetical protein GALMADRAFT_160754 [Galerina marginata CBS 339.88]|uniref:Arf-GAP domain-containing protein n=1 Tax=Galerina marginata (strain CBS 339.88) TaxID=685588 RepID=A0A067SPH3_GALM3|nr:hypothetical protein GALMADRAFT_160754 [Galerina marginata CBS 339.88]
MSRQDKATTDRFARTLRDLVKRPDNKVCADCKRNDPRWASWNLGVFLCIRCSGIHRGMGTHISKVKSVDLDVWTPEQMESIQKWGNHLANLYWEAHLKQGHVPPEHKMESFIRSKYESRRWALDGPPPADPSVLDNDTSSAPLPQASSSQPAPAQPQHRSVSSTSQSRPTHAPTNSFSTRAPAAVPVTTRQPQAHQLLSSNYVNRPVGVVPAPAPPAAAPAAPAVQQHPKAPENDLFSLDFHAPATPANNTMPPEPKKDVKQDILSLFSAPPVSAPAASTAFGQFNNQAAYWGGAAPQQQPMQQQQQQVPVTGMMGGNGTGMWGATSGWSGAPVMPAQPNVWGSPAASIPQQQQQQPQNLFNTNAVWGAPTVQAAAAPASAAPDLFGSSFSTQPVQKKDDVFGDIWGGFK